MKTIHTSKFTNLVRFGLAAAITLLACDFGTAATQAPANTAAPAATQAVAATTAPVSTGGLTPTVITGAGDINAVIEQYRNLLGANNGGEPGSKGTGRREIDWEGVPEDLTAPNTYAGDFFNQGNNPHARGIVLSTDPGATLQVSARTGNATGTLVRFGNINATYPDSFKTFSGESLFSPVGSNIVDAVFFVPGTQIPALVRGFGAVYTDVDTEHTAFEYFDKDGNSLGQFAVPTADNGLSFLGVAFDQPIVAKVRITYGTVALGPNDDPANDVAVMDDFIFGEPVAADGSAVAATQASAPTGFVQDGSAVNRDITQAALAPALAVGSTTSGGPLHTWVIWEENSQGGLRQIFASELVDNAFQPRGAGLNIHLNVVATQSSITFAGEGNAVPWATWAEPSPAFGNTLQIFASRFNTATGLWQPAGQDRGGSEPSLNLHTDREATHPFIFGGSGDPTQPTVPWVVWEEVSGSNNFVQLFVTKGVKDDTALGGFRWDFVGENRFNDEPTLNVDPERDALHPIGVFAETSNAVPWIIWHEIGAERAGRVFTARGVANANVPGGFKWLNVPPCTPDETACTLNVNPLKDAKDAHMVAGSLIPGEAAFPWTVWAEVGPTGKFQILVSRLDPTTRNSFLNVGGSLNVDQNHDAKTPFITFVKNVPYVAWLEDNGSGIFKLQVRHLASDPQTGTWVLDTPAKGFSINPALPDTGLFATSDGNSLIMAWTEGDPATQPSQIIVGHLTP